MSPHRDLSITGHITNETAKCKHEKMMGIWPRGDIEPFMFCPVCGHTEPMTEAHKREAMEHPND